MPSGSGMVRGHDEESLPQVEEADVVTLCGCFRELLPALKPEYTELIEQLELAGAIPNRSPIVSASRATI